jgi:hypothetical protein
MFVAFNKGGGTRQRRAEPKEKRMSTPSPQKAYEVGRNGGTVNTNGLPHQQKERIDAAVNAGRQGK